MFWGDDFQWFMFHISYLSSGCLFQMVAFSFDLVWGDGADSRERFFLSLSRPIIFWFFAWSIHPESIKYKFKNFHVSYQQWKCEIPFLSFNSLNLYLFLFLFKLSSFQLSCSAQRSTRGIHWCYQQRQFQ